MMDKQKSLADNNGNGRALTISHSDASTGLKVLNLLDDKTTRTSRDILKEDNSN